MAALRRSPSFRNLHHSVPAVAEGGAPTSIGGISSSPADKAFNILNSIGNIGACACTGRFVGPILSAAAGPENTAWLLGCSVWLQFQHRDT